MARQQLRCAIYTRKSSEEGLEQEFNSLDAQREACESYIVSQKHEGWTTLPTMYDDGGVSGGTMERPALQRLLADIAVGKVDVVVVYKVDRLTRALADFAKIVEAFDAKDVSFVSVTQQFNTTSSMGRLTLNVLLSFAQFEREVTGERIRDKIAASKKKGMWMGGRVPLGYDLKDRALVVNETEAQTIWHIFGRYAALGSVRALKEELDRDGYVSKRRIDRNGHETGGKAFSRGALYLLIQNRLYHGEIEHKGLVHEGLHDAIIEDDLWRRVQERIAENRVERETGANAVAPSLLAGLVFDENGDRLTPTHANKKGARYRYYVSKGLVQGETPENEWRIPAGELEEMVQNRVVSFLADEKAIYEAVRNEMPDGSDRRRVVIAVSEFATRLPNLKLDQRRGAFRSLISRVVIGRDAIHLYLQPSAILLIVDHSRKFGMSSQAGEDAQDVHLQIPARLKRVGKGKAFVVNGATVNAREPDPALLRLLAQADRFRDLMLAGDDRSMGEIADAVGVGRSYFSRVVRLGFLSPEIVKSILAGDQPYDLSAKRLSLGIELPPDWNTQSAMLGIA